MNSISVDGIKLTWYISKKRGCGKYQTWMCMYVQWMLGTASVRRSVVVEQHFYLSTPSKDHEATLLL